MDTPLLITAFSAFPGVAENPTETLLRSLSGIEDRLLAKARHLVLPTLYGEAPPLLAKAATRDVRAILMTGYSSRASGFVLERRATNRYLPDRPDAGGQCPAPDPAGPLTFETRLDVDAIVRKLKVHGIDADVSDDAGGYVCNHLYRAALSGACAGQTGPVGLFVHLPALPGTELAGSSAGTMTLTRMQTGLALIARAMLNMAGDHR